VIGTQEKQEKQENKIPSPFKQATSLFRTVIPCILKNMGILMVPLFSVSMAGLGDHSVVIISTCLT
jgi:hypothetical protein